jgi:hypothetical protein
MKNGETALPREGAAAGPEAASPSIVSHGSSLPRPAEQGKGPALAPHSDDGPAETLKAVEKLPAVYSPPAKIRGNQTEIGPAAAGSRDLLTQKSPFDLKKPAIAKQKNKKPLSSSVIIISHHQENHRTRSDCSLTLAAKDILRGIISH